MFGELKWRRWFYGTFSTSPIFMQMLIFSLSLSLSPSAFLFIALIPFGLRPPSYQRSEQDIMWRYKLNGQCCWPSSMTLFVSGTPVTAICDDFTLATRQHAWEFRSRFVWCSQTKWTALIEHRLRNRTRGYCHTYMRYGPRRKINGTRDRAKHFFFFVFNILAKSHRSVLNICDR